MVEIQKKYNLKVNKFGFINTTGFISLYARECSRFFVVWAQTLLSPLVSSLLFLSVLSLALGTERGDVLGHPFIVFLAPGLIIQSMMLQSFSHSTSSLMISKMQGNIIDLLYAPLTALEVSISIILAAVTRSIIIGIVSTLVFFLIVDIKVTNLTYILYSAFFGSFFIGSLGFVTGLWATKFDHTATITNFIITPLAFLSGVFYTIDKLPLFFQTVSYFNPFFHIINIFRYGFLGVSDGSIVFGMIYLPLLALIAWFFAFILYKKGYKIKS
jgi:ABC-2 type transport system permease protein